MIGACCKRLQFLHLPSCRNVTHLRLSQKDAIFIIKSSYSSSKSSLLAELDKTHERFHSFTVSYLINSCGLAPELALSVSKKVHLETQERPDSVLNLLKQHGLNDDTIAELVVRRPKYLLVNADKTLLPKLKFFGSIGISGARLGEILYYNPNLILERSLERAIIPCYDIIKSLLLFDEKKVAHFFTRGQRALLVKTLSNIIPNVSVLRALKVPDASISSWVTHHTFAMTFETEKFKENVNKVMSMGFFPSSPATFVKALHVISLTDAVKWAQKMELYRKWGWTEDNFLMAFSKNPLFMNLSEKNFSKKMDFLVNKMGWQSAYLATYPTALTLSLEKRIIPRCKVIRVLLLKGLIVKEKVYLCVILTCRKEHFLDRFVKTYQEQVPELLSIFQGKMSLVELGLGFDE